MQRHGLAQFRHETRELMLHNFARAGRQALICVPDAYSLPVDLSTIYNCQPRSRRSPDTDSGPASSSRSGRGDSRIWR